MDRMFPAEGYGNQAASGAIGVPALGYRDVPPTPPANGRVTDAVQMLARTTEHLQQETAALESRLSGVLRPGAPTGSTNPQQAKATPSALASGLEEIHERLYGLLGHVQSLTARVDI